MLFQVRIRMQRQREKERERKAGSRRSRAREGGSGSEGAGADEAVCIRGAKFARNSLQQTVMAASDKRVHVLSCFSGPREQVD